MLTRKQIRSRFDAAVWRIYERHRRDLLAPLWSWLDLVMGTYCPRCYRCLPNTLFDGIPEEVDAAYHCYGCGHSWRAEEIEPDESLKGIL